MDGMNITGQQSGAQFLSLGIHHPTVLVQVTFFLKDFLVGSAVCSWSMRVSVRVQTFLDWFLD